jgi:DNA helicase-2/ATP-dependent DNA helicase PcrA
MRFVADLHLHSHFSVATSGELKPEKLDLWGRAKGVRLIGTGDFTHPGWLRELREKLAPAEPGLFRLKPEFKLTEGDLAPEREDNSTRFLLTAEISNIYKKSGRVRKVHNLVFAPDFEVVEKIQSELIRLGFNIVSDGRPILGFDSRDLFELLLGASDRVFLVPAHIWTPWFSALGEKSGFDSIEECYGDLAPLICAVETGLSSDPPMNWRCSILDRFALVSNSDAHSPEKIGREATLFDTDLSYDTVTGALRRAPEAPGLVGTVEFFPQEGKYHADGHRKCGVSWTPAETERHKGLCPVCGKPVTVGVMNRVAQLADRPEGFSPAGRQPFFSAIPFAEVLSEILKAGPSSKKVQEAYRAILQKVGPEFHVLLEAPLDELKRVGGELLAEGIRRMRAGEVRLQAGYDGEYGVVRVFDEKELRSVGAQAVMFGRLDPDPPVQDVTESAAECVGSLPTPGSASLRGLSDPEGAVMVCEREITFDSGASGPGGLNELQARACAHGCGPALVLAGPGTGKTRVLTERMARLICEEGAAADCLLAITFTNKAAGEIKARLAGRLLNTAAGRAPWVGTFHGLGYSVLVENAEAAGRTPDFVVIDEEDREAILARDLCDSRESARELSGRISAFKQTGDPGTDEPGFREALERYDLRLCELNLFDLDDLVYQAVRVLERHADLLEEYRRRHAWILVDEYQDINFAQYRLVRLLGPAGPSNLFVIGDPDQAIYGFRGADVRFIDRFLEDYPDATMYRLRQSYRCSGKILKASASVMKKAEDAILQGTREGIRISIARQATDRSEAEFVARTIESMLGGVRFFSIDSEVATGQSPEGALGFSDFAVLCRVGRQMPAFEEAFHNHGVPYQKVDEVLFYKRPPLSGLVDLLRLSVAPDNEFLKRKVAVHGPDLDGLLRRVDEAVAAETPLDQLIRSLAVDTMGDQFSNPETEMGLRRLIEMAADAGSEILELLRRLTLGRGADGYRAGIENVALMTLHAAKGLEFACVFIPGCEDGLLPCSLGARRRVDIEEERRLLYVGMTRAKQSLFLTHAERRFMYGESLTLPRSPFLDSIEQDLIDSSAALFRRRETRQDRQLKLF